MKVKHKIVLSEKHNKSEIHKNIEIVFNGNLKNA